MILYADYENKKTKEYKIKHLYYKNLLPDTIIPYIENWIQEYISKWNKKVVIYRKNYRNYKSPFI